MVLRVAHHERQILQQMNQPDRLPDQTNQWGNAIDYPDRLTVRIRANSNCVQTRQMRQMPEAVRLEFYRFGTPLKGPMGRCQAAGLWQGEIPWVEWRYFILSWKCRTDMDTSCAFACVWICTRYRGYVSAWGRSQLHLVFLVGGCGGGNLSMYSESTLSLAGWIWGCWGFPHVAHTLSLIPYLTVKHQEVLRSLKLKTHTNGLVMTPCKPPTSDVAHAIDSEPKRFVLRDLKAGGKLWGMNMKQAAGGLGLGRKVDNMFSMFFLLR